MAKGDVIPDGEILFKYMNPNAVPEDQKKVPVSIFNYPELSCDWKKYRDDPFTSFHITEGKSKIIEICIHDEIRHPRNPRGEGEIVDAWKQDIVHDPVSEVDDTTHGENEAHSLISGKKKAAVQLALQKHSRYYNLN